MKRQTAGTSPSQVCPTISNNLIAKSERDAELLQHHARFVIVLDEAGTVTLVSNAPRESDGRKIVPLIAVVTNVRHEAGSFRASVAEIGYQRARPYRRVHIDRNRVLLQRRQPVWKLTDTQLQAVYPTILKCLETVLAETRAKWKTAEPWYVGGTLYEKGVQITVSHHDRLLCQALLRESVRYFGVGVCSRSISWINWKLRYSRYISYGRNQYGPNVRLVAEKVVHSVFAENPFWFEALLRHVGKRPLLENALLQLHNFLPEESVETDIAFGTPPVALPEAKGVFFWHTLDQPAGGKGTHADNCTRFEVIYDRRHPNRWGDQVKKFTPSSTQEGGLDDFDFCQF